MTGWRNGVAALVVGLFACVGAVLAQDAAAGFIIDGQVSRQLRLTVDDLKQTSGIEVEATFTGKNGSNTAKYVGVSLFDLLARAKVVDGPGKGAHLRHVIEITGRDGYAVAVAMGEIAPMAEGKPVMIAYLRDGKPVEPAGTVRLVVPGDHHAARSVHDVVRIEVK